MCPQVAYEQALEQELYGFQIEGVGPAAQYVSAQESVSLYEWVFLNRRIENRAFSLESYRPLIAIYQDTHPHKVIMKPAQKGVSEYAVNFACWLLAVGVGFYQLDKAGLNVGYLFPTQAALSDFSKERFAGLRQEAEYFKTLFTDYDDIGFKQAGRSYLYLRGAWSTKALKSFPADAIICDEYDEMDPAAIALAEKRLNNSPLGLRVDISTPTLPGVGIHKAYLGSDQRVWESLCEQCDTWSELEFFRDVKADGESFDIWQYWDAEKLRQAKMSVVCANCGGAILPALAPGRWVATNPDIEGIRGYKIPALAFPSTNLNKLAVNATSTDPTVLTEFFRSDLGLPYEAAGSRITDEMLGQLSSELSNGRLVDLEWSDTTMGVDVGGRHHYRISSKGPDGKRYIRRMGSVKTWQELDTLLDQYKVRRCVIDALPELHACQAWANRHPGRVVRAFYPNSANLKGKLFQPEPEDIEDIVQINRTMAMDLVYANVAGAKEIWPSSIHNDPEVSAHMKAPVRVVTMDAHGQERASWEHTSPDHLFHASVYDAVAGEGLFKVATPQSESADSALADAIFGRGY